MESYILYFYLISKTLPPLYLVRASHHANNIRVQINLNRSLTDENDSSSRSKCLHLEQVTGILDIMYSQPI